MEELHVVGELRLHEAARGKMYLLKTASFTKVVPSNYSEDCIGPGQLFKLICKPAPRRLRFVCASVMFEIKTKKIWEQSFLRFKETWKANFYKI